MSWISALIGNLQRRYTTAKEQAQARQELEATLVKAMADGKLDENELAELASLYQELGLDEAGWRRLQARLYAVAVQQAVADRRLTPEEEKALEDLAAHFGIPADTQARYAGELARYRLLYSLEQGQLPELEPRGLVLQRGEKVHWQEPGEMLEERTRRRYEGGSRGVSIRIARGVSYRIGGHRGRIITEQEIVPVSRGELVITNKRILFRGDQKNFTTPWQKVIDLNLYEDGLRISKEGQRKPALIRFYNKKNAEVVGVICSVILNRYEEQEIMS